jgi:hypothetical protein
MSTTAIPTVPRAARAAVARPSRLSGRHVAALIAAVFLAAVALQGVAPAGSCAGAGLSPDGVSLPKAADF